MKKLFTLFLALVMIVSMAACGTVSYTHLTLPTIA